MTIHHGCTLGCIFEGAHKGSPVLGNHVVMFPGSKVVGNVHIGNNVVIGARSVVTKDIPDNSVAAGVPCRVIKTTDEYLEKIKRESLHLGHLKGKEKNLDAV